MTGEPEVEASPVTKVARFTEEEIADMEADDGRERLMPLWVRRGIAEDMRRINAAEERYADLQRKSGR